MHRMHTTAIGPFALNEHFTGLPSVHCGKFYPLTKNMDKYWYGKYDFAQALEISVTF